MPVAVRAGGARPPGRPNYLTIRAVQVLVVIIALTLVFVIIEAIMGPKKEPVAPQATVPAPSAQTPKPVLSRPSFPPPKFRIYRSKQGDFTTLVVAPATTNEQLKSLLWLLREKVRSHHHKDIGIVDPSNINIYRGDKCAGEYYANTPVNPCGPDDHWAAYYQYGLLYDGVFHPEADSAGILHPDGKLEVVFDHTDNWQLPPNLQASLDAEKKQHEAAEKNRYALREQCAELLQQRLRASGFDISVMVLHVKPKTLVLDSDIFKETGNRVEFLSSVLPKWKADLCSVGFDSVRLDRGGVFSSGDTYSLSCK